MLDDIPPSVANLHGDQIRLVAGGTVRIDAGGDAIVEDGEALTSLDVAFWGSSSNTDRLGIATTGSSRIVLSDGSNPNSTSVSACRTTRSWLSASSPPSLINRT